MSLGSENLKAALVGADGDTHKDLSDEIATVDAFHDVPTADATTNTQARDVTGNKTDAAVGTVGTTKSIIAYIKGILTDTGIIDGYHDVPTANVTTNAQVRDVLGNKTDTKIENVGTTKSVIAYLKGIVQELAQRKTAKSAYNAQTNSTTTVDVVNINDKGVLTGICVTCEDTIIYIKVTIDGTIILYERIIRYVTAGDSYTQSLAFNHRFNTSLRVEHWAGTASKAFQTFVTYTID